MGIGGGPRLQRQDGSRNLKALTEDVKTTTPPKTEGTAPTGKTGEPPKIGGHRAQPKSEFKDVSTQTPQQQTGLLDSPPKQLEKAPRRTSTQPQEGLSKQQVDDWGKKNLGVTLDQAQSIVDKSTKFQETRKNNEFGQKHFGMDLDQAQQVLKKQEEFLAKQQAPKQTPQETKTGKPKGQTIGGKLKKALSPKGSSKTSGTSHLKEVKPKDAQKVLGDIRTQLPQARKLREEAKNESELINQKIHKGEIPKEQGKILLDQAVSRYGKQQAILNGLESAEKQLSGGKIQQGLLDTVRELIQPPSTIVQPKDSQKLLGDIQAKLPEAKQLRQEAKAKLDDLDRKVATGQIPKDEGKKLIDVANKEYGKHQAILNGLESAQGQLSKDGKISHGLNETVRDVLKFWELDHAKL